MTQKFSKGDKVEWKASQGMATGTVQKKVTKPQEVEGHKVAASSDDPRYLVKNDKTGNVTAHKPEILSLQEDFDRKHSSQQNRKENSSSEDLEEQRYIKEFHEAVNMTAKELQNWLKTEESQSVGQKKDDEEAIGHKSGKYIVEILKKKKSDYTDDDIDQMKRVVSYVHRHLAQKPSGDVEDTRWRYSLMNWGHDPLK